MEITVKPLLCFVCIMMALVLLGNAHSQFLCSRATYSGSPDCFRGPSGACGFGEYGTSVNDGKVAGVSRLYMNGSGCGACYQVKCKIPGLCCDDGVTIVATDYGEGDQTDFIMSVPAFVGLANPNTAFDLMSYGVVDVDYRRVPCAQRSSNLLFKIHEHSRFPDYLALVILYVAGQYDAVAVDLWQEDCKEWRNMRRAFGTVWDMANPPRGHIDMRVQLSSNSGLTWVQTKTGIPTNWKPGAAYESYAQLP